MANRWFNVPEVQETNGGQTVYLPAHYEKVEAFAAFTIGQSPRFVVRYYADEETLDEIANQNQVAELSEEGAVNRIENVEPDVDWDPETLDRSFRVG